MKVVEDPFMFFRVSSHIVLGFPHSTFPSHHMSQYLIAARVTLDSSVHSDLMVSSTHTLFFVSIQDTLITRLHHHL